MKIATFLLSVAILISAAYFLGFIVNKDQDVTLSPNVYLTQYSDQNITESAILKDEKFSHLAFAPAPQTPFLENRFELASVFASIRSFFSKKEKEPKFEEHGTWLWTPTMQLTDEYMQKTLDEALSEGVNTLYLSIDSYLDVYVMDSGPEKEELKKAFSEKIEKFISYAEERGIKVDAEAGWRNWAERGHTYKPLAIAEFVVEYNRTHDKAFRGFQYDIEPYLLDEYKEDPAAVLKNFISLVDQTVLYLEGSDLQFSVVIPEFYDKRDRVVPVFSYRGKRDSAFGHLLSVLETRPRSSIIIMSYRNFAYGKDGSIDISKNEMRTAKLGRFSTKIILAQETGDVEPMYVTFHSTSKGYFANEVKKLRDAFAGNDLFGGMAIHYANAYFELH